MIIINGTAVNTQFNENPGRFHLTMSSGLESNYWILALGAIEEDQTQYPWAVVSDEIQGILFISARNVTEFRAKYEQNVAKQNLAVAVYGTSTWGRPIDISHLPPNHTAKTANGGDLTSPQTSVLTFSRLPEDDSSASNNTSSTPSRSDSPNRDHFDRLTPGVKKGPSGRNISTATDTSNAATVDNNSERHSNNNSYKQDSYLSAPIPISTAPPTRPLPLSNSVSSSYQNSSSTSLGGGTANSLTCSSSMRSTSTASGFFTTQLQAESDCLPITPDMMVIQFQSIATNELSQRVKEWSAEEPKVLVGWQIALQAVSITPEIIHKDLYVVMDTRKTLARKTEFKLCAKKLNVADSTASNGVGFDGRPVTPTEPTYTCTSFWTLLKRSDKKHGPEFAPLQQVLFLGENVQMMELMKQIELEQSLLPAPSPVKSPHGKSPHNRMSMINHDGDNLEEEVEECPDFEQSDGHRLSILDRASVISLSPAFESFAFPDLTASQQASFTDRRHTHNFNVRGKSYGKDGKKIYGGSAMCKLMLLEVYEVDVSVDNAPKGGVWNEKCSEPAPIYDNKRHDHVVSRGAAKRRMEAIAALPGQPMQIIINMQIPGDPPVSC
eukprot:gene25050-31460_t